MMFASVAVGLPLPFLNIIAAIVYYYTNRSKGNFVRYHSLHSLYSQLPVSLLNSAGVVWTITNLVKDLDFTPTFWGYVIAMGVCNIAYIIFSIVGAVRAHQGRFYYFLFFGKVAYAQVYRIRQRFEVPIQNRPPNM